MPDGTADLGAPIFERLCGSGRTGAMDPLTMATTFFHLTTLAVVLVLGVLAAGLWNMTREGTASLSQKLMRWRVGLQFVAIVIIMLAVYFKRAA